MKKKKLIGAHKCATCFSSDFTLNFGRGGCLPHRTFHVYTAYRHHTIRTSNFPQSIECFPSSISIYDIITIDFAKLFQCDPILSHFLSAYNLVKSRMLCETYLYLLGFGIEMPFAEKIKNFASSAKMKILDWKKRSKHQQQIWKRSFRRCVKILLWNLKVFVIQFTSLSSRWKIERKIISFLMFGLI